MSEPLMAKRVAPAKITPIEHNNHRYYQESKRAADVSSFSMSIVRVEAGSDKPVWKTEIYNIRFHPQMSTDVQEIELKSLVLKDGRLHAIDEAGTHYEVDATSGALLSPTSPKHYDKSR